ncbi:zinc-ribbon domain and TM2 domain-containing protein [Oleiagrimonas soli]|uniref:TM2 domain-containing membrane protein YozV n=1 Tax=Oleiagrimonas soli TaxID=1543381 RepID=A0A841KDM6_9GAMM|nr:TM2 domain-containing protein [Oleiagrimonas soli]MBB6183025.1 TM2 domain-containing membrane protein YozV [Oleiagrimonas soli]
MFCSHCGSEVADHAVVCVKCGASVAGRMPPQAATASAGVAPPVQGSTTTIGKSRVAYVLFGVFLGGLGIHNFYAGYAGRGVAQLLVSLLLGWLIVPLLAVYIWVIVEVCTVEQDAYGVPFT